MDFSTLPLTALSIQTKDVIATLLNPKKCIPTDSGLPRDWRGLAHLAGIKGETMPSLASKPNPCNCIIESMQKKGKNFFVKDLLDMLEKLGRGDILEDTETLIVKDAENFTTFLERCQTSALESGDNDNENLTIDDVQRSLQGLKKQHYDAFLLYADEDKDFAKEIIENLENKYKKKLCLRDRDLIGGTFEHDAIMQLIADRCNRIIVVVSPNFLNCSANKFFLNYAQALGIDTRRRKVIPCLYKRCQIPRELRYMFVLDYNKIGLYNFWEKLRDSVEVSNVPACEVTSKDESPALPVLETQSSAPQLTRESVNPNEVSEPVVSEMKEHFFSPAVPDAEVKKPKKTLWTSVSKKSQRFLKNIKVNGT